MHIPKDSSFWNTFCDALNGPPKYVYFGPFSQHCSCRLHLLAIPNHAPHDLENRCSEYINDMLHESLLNANLRLYFLVISIYLSLDLPAGVHS